MSFSITYWATVNTGDGTITGTGQTDSDNNPMVPAGSVVVSADQHATIVAAEADGFQCKLISGVVRLMKLPTPAPIDLGAIKDAAYVTIDAEAELARGTFLTPGSGQALEYQQTAANAQALMDKLNAARSAALAAAAVTGTVAAETSPPRAGTDTPQDSTAAPAVQPAAAPASAAPVFDPADYPWLVAEQNALAAIGYNMTLPQVADAVLATMRDWDTAGSQIKQVRREAKLKVQVAKSADEISAILTALSWPTANPSSSV